MSKKGLKKYLSIEYGEYAPEVEVQPALPVPDDLTMEYIIQNYQESQAMITQKMMCRAVYPKLMTVKTENLFFESDGFHIPMRVYYPDGEGDFPIVLYYHGGGWVYNNLDVYDYVTRYIAKFSGSVVLSVDYRLAPRYKYPAPLRDCYAALEWADANRSRVRGNSEAISVGGDSAGGNLAAAVSLMARDKKGPSIREQILIYAALDLTDTTEGSYTRYKEGYYLEKQSMDDFTKQYVEKDADLTDPYLSPLLADNLAGLPEAVFINSECDVLVDDSLEYAQRLADAGVKVDFHLYKGMPHGFIADVYQKTFEALHDICTALKTSRRA